MNWIWSNIVPTQFKKQFTFPSIMLLGNDFPERKAFLYIFPSCQVANVFLSDHCPISRFRVFLFLASGEMLTMHCSQCPTKLITPLFLSIHLWSHTLFHHYFVNFCKWVTFFHCVCNSLFTLQKYIIYIILLYRHRPLDMLMLMCLFLSWSFFLWKFPIMYIFYVFPYQYLLYYQTLLKVLNLWILYFTEVCLTVKCFVIKKKFKYIFL